MKRKFQKLFIACAMFISLPFMADAKNCGCSQGGATPTGYDWNVPDGTGCCTGGGSGAVRTNYVRGNDGTITRVRTAVTVLEATNFCC